MGQRITITIEIQQHAIPAAVRLRRLLKVMLRSLGMRCIACRKQPQANDSDLRRDGETGQ